MRFVGGKSRSAKAIVNHILNVNRLYDRPLTTYIEPFVGGGAVLRKAAPHFRQVLALDYHQDLIDLYLATQAGWEPPEHISEQRYLELRDQPEHTPERTFAGYGASFGGKWFGGYARSSEGRNYAAETARSLKRTHKAAPHAQFMAADFLDIDPFSVVDPRAYGQIVMYADPPEGNQTGYRTYPQFNYQKAWYLYHKWGEAGAHVFVSGYHGPSEHIVETFKRSVTIKPTGGKREQAFEKLFYIPPAKMKRHT